MTTKYAEVTYPNAGGATEFSIPFVYLEQKHLVVTLNAVTQSNGTDYTINESTSKVVFTSPTTAGHAVVITRTTPIEIANLAVKFTNGSGLGADDLNSSVWQTVLAVQEMNDTIDESIAIVDTAMLGANNLSDVDSASTSRTNIDVYSKSETDSIFADATNALLKANNLSDVTSASTSRTNLGLGTIATQDSDSVAITGGSVTGITDLTIADGGTGASTKTVAFDNLSPTTTKGDVIVNDGSDNIRVGVGSNDEVLVADSSEASGVKWGEAPVSCKYAWGSLSANQTVTTATETLANLNTASYDEQSWVDTTNKRITPDISGCYRVDCKFIWFGLGDNINNYAAIRKNGSAIEVLRRGSTNVSYIGETFSTLVTCNGTTDYIDFVVYHEKGTDTTLVGSSAGDSNLKVQYIGS